MSFLNSPVETKVAYETYIIAPFDMKSYLTEMHIPIDEPITERDS